MKLVYFLVVALVAISHQGFFIQAQECSASRTYSPEVCLFSGSLTGISGGAQSNICQGVNPDPINVPPMTGYSGVSAATCSNAVFQDGNACEKFYAEYQCAFACPACAQLPCQYLCLDAPSICPTAHDAGCFGSGLYCSSSNTTCTFWKIDKSKLPSGPSGSTTTTKAGTHSTTMTSSQSHSTTTSNSPSLLHINLILFGFILFLNKLF